MRVPLKSYIQKRLLEYLLVHRINLKYQSLKTKRHLNGNQKKSVQTYFKKYCGHRVSLAWHRYMYSRTGVFSIKYIPTSLYRTELIGRMNRWDRGVFSDKNLTCLFFPEVNQPHTILSNMNGYYYIDGLAVSKEEASIKCKNLTNVVIKPSLLDGGKGVQMMNVVDGITSIDGMSIDKLFECYEKDFIIQERVMQHMDMDKLNPTSVNTIRLLTYRTDMEVLLLYAVIRIGKSGMVVDNESQGGISVKICQDGTLSKYAYGAPGEEMIEKTDSGVIIDGYKIPSYDKVVSMAKKCHYRLPFFNIVGWDFCVDVNGDPLLIEWNANPDLSQTANGPAFGKYTDEILSDVYKRCNTRNSSW